MLDDHLSGPWGNPLETVLSDSITTACRASAFPLRLHPLRRAVSAKKPAVLTWFWATRRIRSNQAIRSVYCNPLLLGGTTRWGSLTGKPPLLPGGMETSVGTTGAFGKLAMQLSVMPRSPFADGVPSSG